MTQELTDAAQAALEAAGKPHDAGAHDQPYRELTYGTFSRPCWGGPCTAKGMAEPGFCKCKADAAEIERLRADYGALEEKLRQYVAQSEHDADENERLEALLSMAEGCAGLSSIGIDVYAVSIEVTKDTMAKLITAEAEIERLEAEKNRPWLGLATTRQLLDELRARIEMHALGGLDYRTVDGETFAYGARAALAGKQRFEIIEDGLDRWVLVDNESDDPCPVYETEKAARAALAGKEGI